MIKAVLFDLDDTLVHRKQSLLRYIDKLCEDMPDLADYLGRNTLTELIITTDNGGYLKPGTPYAQVRELVSDTLVAQLNGRCAITRVEIEEHWKTWLPRSTVEMPGAVDLLSELKDRGMKLAVISNGSHRSRELTVSLASFAPLIDRVYSSGLVGVKKPARKIFDHALNDLGVKAEQTWFVGDHPVNDVQGATEMGMTAIWLEGFQPWPHDRESPAHSVQSLDQVPALLELGK